MSSIENWSKLDPSMKKCWIIKGLFSAFVAPLFFLLPAFFTLDIFAIFIYFAAVIAIMTLITIWSVMFYNRYRFKIDNESVEIKSGILWKKDVTIPYERIQHVSSTRGPVEQLFDLHIINIFTAGTGSIGGGYGSFGSMGMFAAEGYIPGIKEPEKVKKFIMGQVKRSRSESGLGESTVRTEKPIHETGTPNNDILDELRKIRRIMENQQKAK